VSAGFEHCETSRCAARAARRSHSTRRGSSSSASPNVACAARESPAFALRALEPGVT